MLTTESSSNYDNLEQMSTRDLLTGMNNEDKTVPLAVEEAIPQIEALVNATVERMQNGGRLFYIGSGTSGRLGIVDASECPPTYGVPHGLVVGVIAGGDTAIRKAVENAEDNANQGWIDLNEHNLTEYDTVIGISASGSAPYVYGALQACQEAGIATGAITCNKNGKISEVADFPIEVIVGPEFVTGSTRMKSGTAQKLALNMISTSLMIKLGHVKGNRMIDMQLSNKKLVKRGTQMIVEELGVGEDLARELLLEEGSVRKAIEFYRNKKA
jgi:N-acetylmuramic acid 6-phosphate etherase